MAERSSFDIVLKVAERCNLACSYCYYFYQEFDNAKSPPIIRPNVVKQLATFLQEAARDTSINHFNIVLHGGEPLLVKKPYFDEICTTLRSALEGHADVSFAIQTNGVLIDDEWIEIFAKHKITTGISVDGLKSDHDLMRPDKKGVGSYDRAIRGLRLLQKAVGEGKLRAAGVLGVVPAHVSGEAFLQHMIEDLGVRSPGLNFPRGGWDNSDAVEWNSDTEARRDLVATWLRDYVHPRFSYITHFADILFGLMSDKGAAMLDRKLSRRHHILTVSSSGEMLIDDNLLGLDGVLSQEPMSIFDSTFLDFLASPVWQDLQAAVDTVPSACSSCVWHRSCRSGNLYNRHSKEFGFKSHSVLCESIKAMHEEIATYLITYKKCTLDEIIDRLKQGSTCSADQLYRELRKEGVSQHSAMELTE